MFKIKSLIALSALILFVPTPAKAEWIPMGTLKDNSEIYIDIDSATVQNSLITFWQRRLLAIALPDGASTVDMKMVIDCHSSKIRTTRFTSFDRTGRQVFNSPANEPFRIINANSIQADVADFLCH